MYDAIIIGAGVVGCAVAQQMARYGGKLMVIDRMEDVADGASKANSGIVHAGFDAHPGTEKARLNVKGAKMYKQLAAELGVPYGQPGALVLAFSEDDRATLENLLAQSKANDVEGCRIIEREEILQMEPNTNPEVVCALYAPTSGLVSPYEMTCALADSAAENGAEFSLENPVLEIKPTADGNWLVIAEKGEYKTRAVVNCAGIGSGVIHNMISTRKVKMIARRGEYYLLDHMADIPFTMTMFQCPTKMGKGVLVSPTTHGNILLGPTANDIDNGYDVATTRAGLDDVMAKVRLTWPKVNLRQVITTFSGIRAHEEHGDFIIGKVEGAPAGAYEAVGVESPGLSAAPAIGQELGDEVAAFLGLEKKADWKKPTPLPKTFRTMTDAERAAAYEKDPEYGTLVCRCEQVTEAEIRAAIRRPVGARSIDGVKRRTRAGMGRCQGGFCSPRVMEILCEELGVSPLEITKCGGESKLLVGTLHQIAKEARPDEK
ncbi:MAG: NAD(P)/FAD-dependent oxidoreductase [Clostridia bacterium]|nr:NAD(P)/FAD-dependent oxidoreductase [Clostridia bacterium]